LYSQTSKAASGPLGIEPVDVPIHGLADIDHAVTSLADSSDTGIFFLPDISTLGLRHEVVNLAARRQLPAVYWDTLFVKAGGLASYAPDRIDIFRRAAGYVDRILRGEKAADLPFQQPTKYELVINTSRQGPRSCGTAVIARDRRRADRITVQLQIIVPRGRPVAWVKAVLPRLIL
jgi:putative ABC transport system substrate-binding protein